MTDVAKVRRRRNTSKTEEESPDTSFSLPIESNQPPTELSDSIIAIYGRKGVGKTTLASSFDRSVTMMLERNRRNLRIVQVNPENFRELIGYVDAFLESNDHDTCVIDTIDQLYDMCMDYVCSNKGITHPNQANDYGQTWREIKHTLRDLCGRVQDSGKGLIFISHEDPKPLNIVSKGLRREEDELPEALERMQPSCSKGAFEVIEEICDYVFYYGFYEGKRAITVRSPAEVYWTSCGMSDQFLDPDGTPINTFLVGDTPEEAYSSLLKAHKNELRDITYTPPRESRRKKSTDQ